MALPVVCLVTGVFASARWLPELEHGRVGGITFFAVSGMLGAVVAVLGLHRCKWRTRRSDLTRDQALNERRGRGPRIVPVGPPTEFLSTRAD